MPYLRSFDSIRRDLVVTTVRGELQVRMGYENFLKLIKDLLEAVPVNEDWYLKRYEDIAEAMKDGDVASVARHFAQDGYAEGRMPFPIEVDEGWYLEQNPDVADSVRKGDYVSAQEHFEKDGYREGRRPYAAHA